VSQPPNPEHEIWHQPSFKENFRTDDIPKVNLGRGYNRHGYQSDEFDARGDINLMFLGDSWGQGDGLDIDLCYDKILRAKLEHAYGCQVTIWNLSHGGKG